MGWTCHVDAQNGTGLVNDGFLAGPGLAPLIERLPQTAGRVGADLVIVDAGRNDCEVPDDAVRAAATRYLTALREAFPSSRLVMVLPTLLGPRQPPEYRRVAEVLRDVAAAQGADVVDPASVDHFADRADSGQLTCPDGFHPSAAGQAHYADVLTRLLSDLGLRPGTATMPRTISSWSDSLKR
jgi:lysophospholipase L1-like esterase